jgi:dynein heavy chain
MLEFVVTELLQGAMEAVPAAPVRGTVAVPAHQMIAFRLDLEKNSFLCSKAGLDALAAVVEKNVNIQMLVLLPTAYKYTYKLGVYSQQMNDILATSVRLIKQDWPQQTAMAVRKCLALDPYKKYDTTIRNVHEFENSNNPIKMLLTQVNFMMTNVLTNVVANSYKGYCKFIQDLCRVDIEVDSISSIRVKLPTGSVYRNVVHSFSSADTLSKNEFLPPLFSLYVQVSAELRVLNQLEVDLRDKEIADWDTSTSDCPLHPVQPIMGRAFEFDTELTDFKAVILNILQELIVHFLEVPHVRKYILDKIYFPVPCHIGSVSLSSDELGAVSLANDEFTTLTDDVRQALDRTIAPLYKYIELFKPYEAFLNIDSIEHIREFVKVTRKDPDSTEIELPVTVSLTEVAKFLDGHQEEISRIEQDMPLTLDSGLFEINVESVRRQLLDKHKMIIETTLQEQCSYSKDICKYLDQEFKKILQVIGRSPNNIEELVELEDYIASVGQLMQPLQVGISDMMAYYNLLEVYRHKKIELEHSMLLWYVVAAPDKVLTRCMDVKEQNVFKRGKFLDEMQCEQEEFRKEQDVLTEMIDSLEEYKSLEDVKISAAAVRLVRERMLTAKGTVGLFQDREGLFEISSPTEYDELTKLEHRLNNYVNLWVIADEWLDDIEKWKGQLFSELDAEEIDSHMEQYKTGIIKAAKFFANNALIEQSNVADLIKAQVIEFEPEVPLIVNLRNPGMRDRHWDEIASHLQVEFPPIAEMTTTYLLGLKLNEHREYVEKVAESAAKEYNIELQLDKMEREWENLNLEIHSYKETGTYVLKGVDDINAILDEQITSTQAIMFSSFKGPFEKRIDDWNKKLNCVQEVLDVWIKVQRNWLYLQPIFDSADIKRQLPTEGAMFDGVDKNWRFTLANAKSTPKILEFCDNEKLLELISTAYRKASLITLRLSDQYLLVSISYLMRICYPFYRRVRMLSWCSLI